MTVRRRFGRTIGPGPRWYASKAGKWWLGYVPVSPDTARLGELTIILGKNLRFNRLIVNEIGRKAPPMIHFTVGDQRVLCINTISERFELDHDVNDQRNAAAEMLKRSVTVLKEKGYAGEFALARKRESYNYVFDPHHRLYAIAEPEVDHDTIEESFEALKKLKIIEEGSPAQYERGAFKADQDLIA